MSRRPISEQQLRNAASALRSTMLESLPREAEGQFSEAFEQSIAELAQVRKKHEKLLVYRRQLAAAMVAYILFVSAFFTLHTDAHATDAAWFTEAFHTHTFFWFSGEKPAELPMFAPSGLSDSYECVYDEILVNSRTMLYTNAENEADGFTFDYGFIQGEAPLTVDYRGTAVAVEDVTIHGCPGKLYISADPGESHALVWIDEASGLVFSITSFLDPQVMLHIAESVILVK